MSSTTASLHKTSHSLRAELPDRAESYEGYAPELVSVTLFEIGAQAIRTERSAEVTILNAGFPTAKAAEEARDEVLRRHGSIVHTVEIEEHAPTWIHAQREALTPTTAGRWHIRAPWHDEALHIDPFFEIIIDPGAAFGHGGHPSTVLAADLLTRALDPNPARRVFDIGTGTGVLAIIAARMGASVIATDIDNDALTTAYLNIDRNSAHLVDDDLVDRIVLGHPIDIDTSPTPDDVVVANVTIDVHRELAPRFQHVERVICSGLLCRQFRAVDDLYPGHRASTVLVSGEWAAVDFSSFAAIGRKT